MAGRHEPEYSSDKQIPKARAFGAIRESGLIYEPDLPSPIRTIPSAPEFHRILRTIALAGCTADWELLSLTLPRRFLFSYLGRVYYPLYL